MAGRRAEWRRAVWPRILKFPCPGRGRAEMVGRPPSRAQLRAGRFACRGSLGRDTKYGGADSHNRWGARAGRNFSTSVDLPGVLSAPAFRHLLRRDVRCFSREPGIIRYGFGISHLAREGFSGEAGHSPGPGAQLGD